MTRLSKEALFASLFALCWSQASAQDGATPLPKPFDIVWENGEELPGVCVGTKKWIVGVLSEKSSPNASVAPQIRIDGVLINTKLLHVDQEHRLCVLESKSPLTSQPSLKLSQSCQIEPGTLLISLGANAGCKSRVAGKDVRYFGEALSCPLIRVRLENADHHFCRPGTPLVDQTGLLKGFLTGRSLLANQEAHAIPSAIVSKIIAEIETLGRSGPVHIGFVCHTQSTTPEIMAVRKGSPAEKAGLQKGDIVQSINDDKVDTFSSLIEIIKSLPAQKAARFKIMRGMKELVLEVVPEFAKTVAESG